MRRLKMMSQEVRFGLILLGKTLHNFSAPLEYAPTKKVFFAVGYCLWPFSDFKSLFACISTDFLLLVLGIHGSNGVLRIPHLILARVAVVRPWQLRVVRVLPVRPGARTSRREADLESTSALRSLTIYIYPRVSSNLKRCY